MSEPIEPRRGVAPKVLRVARVILYVQAVATVLITAFDWLIVSELVQHNQEVSGFDYLASYLGVPVSVLLLVCAALVASRRRWVRPLTVAMEVVVIVNGVINVSSGFVQALAAIAIAIGVVSMVCRPEVGAWIEGRDAIGA